MSTWLVSNPADSGPGSLRQAVLDSNAATGATNTIDFAIPGTGIQTIAPISPLPPITNPVLIDGTSQPGFAGTPPIDLTGEVLAGSDPLTIASTVTVHGLSIDGFTLDPGEFPDVLTVPSVPFPGSGNGPGAPIDSYHLETTTGEDLAIRVHAMGVTTRLLLRDTGGNVLMQSDGQSPADGDDMINVYVPPGRYSLEVQDLGGAGTYNLTTIASPATSPLEPIPVGRNPDDIVSGDFNGDGRLDLAISNGQDNTVSVLLGDGDGSFRPQVTYTVGSVPWAIVAGDFNDDGRIDLVVTNRGDDTASVLMGNGDGTFQPQVTYAVGSSPDAIVSGDFNGDGHLDLAVANGNQSGDTVSILMGDGDGTFRPQASFAAGLGQLGIVAGDFDGDGHLDLAVAVAGDSNGDGSGVSVLLGNGDGTFQDPVSYAAGALPAAIVAGDFNGDGHLDLAVANIFDDTVSVLPGDGDGTFAPQVTSAVGSWPASLTAGDFNGDGHLDLAVANEFSDYTSVLLGHGDGSFSPQVTYAVGSVSYSIAAGDFNGDGHLDLANTGDVNISVFLNDGDGTFQPLVRVRNGVQSEARSLVAGDFNGDGYADLAVANQLDGTVSVLLGDGDGTFQPQVTYAVGTFPVCVVSGDFNGDGRIDLAVANGGDGTISVLLGDGDGTFQPQVTYAGESSVQSLAVGDFNGDGHLDLAVANYGDDDVGVLLGRGDGTFQPQVTFAVGSEPVALTAGDFNGDGYLDLAVTGIIDSGTGSCDVSVLLGNGDGSFSPQSTYAVGVAGFSIVSGDFNGDGRLDLAVANGGDGTVSVLLGDGEGRFAPQVTYTAGSGSMALTAGDFNDDGRLDLGVVDAEDDTVSVLIGNGDGTFAPRVTYAVGSSPQFLAAVDFNGDGRLDLAFTDYGDSTVPILLGDGDGGFIDPGQLVTAPHATPLVADVNGDGTDDVLIVEGSGNILYRQGIPGQPGTFDPPATVNPGFRSRDITWVLRTDQGPLLASVDAKDDAVSLYAWRDGGFARIGSLATGLLPAQIITADLNDSGWDGLVVRNAGDGTLSLFFSNTLGSLATGFKPFHSAVTLDVGQGVSDVAAVTNGANNRIYLVITNQLTGEVTALGDGSGGVIAAPEPYLAGTGLDALDTSGGSPVVTSLEATSGVVAGAFTTGDSTDLVTMNPGTKTIGLLAGLGNGRFANPVTFSSVVPARLVRVAEFNRDGIPDLAVLTAKGVSIYLGDGKGGFLPPVTYVAGADPTGLSVADILGNGQLDLLVGNVYGDVLILVGQGDGTFRPFEPVKAAIALAVADLNGNGVSDFVFADQSLNRVTVVYGSDKPSDASPQVLGDQATGVLAPGAVLLADMNGDGIPDLVVANSGGNNVLVYPGLGNGQFGPPIDGTQGFPVGTDPTGLVVADLNGQPDLLVADTGSNDVSVLLGQGSGSSWTMIPGPRVQTDAGPVAVAVGDLLGDTQTDLAVANGGANDVQVFPGVGGGFFNDQPQAVTTVRVGKAPSSLFLGDFNGLGQELATLNAGSNDGTLISGLGAANPVIQTFPTGGDTPTSGFAGDFTGDGFTDLVVGNNADGRLALLMGGSGGLSLTQTLYSPEAPAPTGLSFAGVSGDLLSFYVSTAGREAAMNLTFDVDAGPGGVDGPFAVAVTLSGGSSLEGVLSQATSGSVQQVSQLLTISGTTLDLAATLLTVSVLPGTFEGESGGGGFATVGSTGFGQPAGPVSPGGGSGGSGEDSDPVDAGAPVLIDGLPAWERVSIGLERAWERARAAILGLEGEPSAARDRGASAPAADRPSSGPASQAPARPGGEAGTKDRSRTVAPSASADHRHDDQTAAIDAAMADPDLLRSGESPIEAQGPGFSEMRGEDASTGRVRILAGLAATIAAAGAGGTPVARWVRRRSASPGLP